MPPSDLSLLLSTQRNCFYGDCAVRRLVRQYRACVVDSLGLGVTCLLSLYYVPDLVSFAIPIFHIRIVNVLVSSHF